jgi:cytochrome bd-type quinol oxidase subunit 2
MLIKLLLIALLLFIVFNLFRALWLMLKNDPEKVSMSKFLGRRVLVSVIVMMFIVLALSMGWVSPHQRPY